MTSASFWRRSASVSIAGAILWVGVPASAVEGWQSTGSMSETRLLDSWHGGVAVTLSDGRVFVAGGRDIGPNGTIARASAEIFNPSSGTWSSAGSMSVPRWDHTATLLTDGRILLAGGNSASGYAEGHTASAEIFDPSVEGFTSTGSMSVPRMNHTAVVLSDGRVLISGGRSSNFNYLASAEIFDPATGAFSPAASPPEAKTGGFGVLLADGRVLVTGGIVPYVSTNTAAVYDPVSNSWMSVGPMTTIRTYHTATRLGDGRVQIVGGERIR